MLVSLLRVTCLRDEVVQEVHVTTEFAKGYLCIDLGSGDVSVPQQTADALDGHAGVEGHDGKGVAGAVEGDVLVDAAGKDDVGHMLGQCAIVDIAENSVSPLLVALDNGDGRRQQPYLKLGVGLVALCQHPLLPLDGVNVGRAQPADVGKGHTRQCREDKNVAMEGLQRVGKLVVDDLIQLLLGQILPRADVAADVEGVKGITAQEAALIGTRDNALQLLAGQPHGASPIAAHGAEPNGKVVDETGRQFC